jgi:hypothetical protein
LIEDVSDQRRTRWEFEPLANVLQMGGHGTGRDEQPLADFGMGRAVTTSIFNDCDRCRDR